MISHNLLSDVILKKHYDYKVKINLQDFNAIIHLNNKELVDNLNERYAQLIRLKKEGFDFHVFVEELDEHLFEPTYERVKISRFEDKYLLRFRWCESIIDMKKRHSFVFLHRKKFNHIDLDNALRGIFALYCKENDSILFHSACVVDNGEAYLFFGPQNSGKSTISGLLSKQAKVISDDLVRIIFKKNMEPHVQQVVFRPWEQRVDELDHREYPIKTMFRIFKDKELKIKKEKNSEKFYQLISEIPFVILEKKEYEWYMDKVQKEMIPKIDYYSLYFKKDELSLKGVVEIVDKIMEKNFEDVLIRFAEKKIVNKAHLDITYRCNLKCVHCYLNNLREGFTELDTSEILKVLEQLAEENVLFLTFSGGEPFLRKDFVKILNYAKNKYFVIDIFTNGTILNEEILKELSSNKNIRRIIFSIYGCEPSVHDAITTIPGSFEKMIKNFRIIKEKAPHIKLKFAPVLMKDNWKGPDNFKKRLKFIEDIGAGLKKVGGFITPIINSNKEEELNLSEREMFELLDSKKEDIAPKEKMLDEYVCAAGVSSIAIKPNGDVIPCVELYKIILGNVLKTPLKIILSEREKYFKPLKLKEMKKCASCEYLDFCGPCPGMNLNAEGDVLKPYKFSCIEARCQKKIYDSKELKNE